MIGIVNFGATLIGLVLLNKWGRRTIMIFGNIGMAILLFCIGIFLFTKSDGLMVLSVLLYIAFFELSTGPIMWLYLAEIMYEEGLSAATGFTWCLMLLISLILPLL